MACAGILPYTIIHDELFFLLGCETSDGSWSDFGGKSEFEDAADLVQTACREFAEETLGSVLVNNQELRRRVLSEDTLVLRSTTYSGKPYTTYVVHIPWSPQYMIQFYKTHRFLTEHVVSAYRKYLEKFQIRWFHARDILESSVTTHVARSPLGPIRLRTVFSETLRENGSTIATFFGPSVSNDGELAKGPRAGRKGMVASSVTRTDTVGVDGGGGGGGGRATGIRGGAVGGVREDDEDDDDDDDTDGGGGGGGLLVEIRRGIHWSDPDPLP